ncbi:MAG: hypothetical protein FD166_1258 [Bacteroidetes bacterium]|nr:MAG: hypothetical protein FD166_1258 [Bacteroidota bacterium]
MNISIKEVTGQKQLRRFICFPKDLYRQDRNFIFEPVMMQMDFFSGKNPFFEHSQARYFIAVSDHRIVGRIAAIVNTVHNETYSVKTGFFGFFESVDNYEVAVALLDKVVEIHRENGFNRVTGPVNFTTNDSCGLLISGFDIPPVVMMPYNKPWYNDFLIRYGFEKEMELSSYYIGDGLLKSPAYMKLSDRLCAGLAASGITIRTINYKKLDEEIIPFREVYNQSNSDNWGFIPLNEREFSHTAHQFRQFVPEKLMLIVEKDGQQIGFIVALPDLNQVFGHMRSGKMLPTGLLKFLWYRRKITGSRILILGILKEYRNKGIDVVLYRKIQENLATMGIYHGEACYVMEDNLSMNSIMQKLGGTRIKRYRIYKFENFQENTQQ